MWLLVAFACAPTEAPAPIPEDPPALTPPPLDGLDLESAIAAALDRAVRTSAGRVLDAHVGALDQGTPTCPDLYLGAPPEGDPDLVDGHAWADHCDETLSFDGWASWSIEATSAGDPNTPVGRTIDGTRRLEGDLQIWRDELQLLGFDGVAEDSLSRTDTDAGASWRWASYLEGSVEGTLTDLPKMRAELSLEAVGGPAASLTLRGDVYAPSAPLDDVFDSLRLDIAWQDPATSFADCPDEPVGWIGVRDDEAWWFDVVFQPLPGDVDPTPNPCDGCGELYIRGLPTETLVCPDLSFLWLDDTIVPPALSGFAPAPRVEVAP
jgi:hypothetical protein